MKLKETRGKKLRQESERQIFFLQLTKHDKAIF